MNFSKYKWSDGPNRKERRRRYAIMRMSYRNKHTKGAFGASRIDSKRAETNRKEKSA